MIQKQDALILTINLCLTHVNYTLNIILVTVRDIKIRGKIMLKGDLGFILTRLDNLSELIKTISWIERDNIRISETSKLNLVDKVKNITTLIEEL